MKILITGTHFTPAIAVIEALQKMGEQDIVYVGRKTTLEGDRTRSVESKILPALGVKFIPVIAGRLQRSFTPFTIVSFLKIPIGFLQTLFVILSEKPDVILSFGGYVGVPIVIWGWLLSVPVIIHEQTLVTGLANKISSFFADKIAVSFGKSTFKGRRVILTGNPIRQEIIDIKKVKLTQSKGGLPMILVMGGNQGSHIINLIIEKCLTKLLKFARVYHQTGDSKYLDFERLTSFKLKLGDLGQRYTLKKWIGEEYGKVLMNADLVVCRAGINTLSELAYLGKPALVIPIPYLYQDEQNKNASFFEDLGLIQILPQYKLSEESLVKEIKSLLKNLTSITGSAKQAGSVVDITAARRLALETILLGKI